MRVFRLWLLVFLVTLVGSTLALPRSVAWADGPPNTPQSRQITLDTGVTLTYVRQGGGFGPVLIFIPGYTDSHRSFERTLPYIPGYFRSYVLTMRGHGDSSKPTCCYGQADFAADVVAFMDELNIRKATIVGHSMGSFIAQQVALDYPSYVEGLVLVGSAPSPQNAEVLGLNDYIQSLDTLDPVFVHDFQASTFYQPLPETFIDMVTQESLKVPLPVWKQALAGMVAVDHSTQLGSITTPTLIIGGAQDSYFVPAGQQALDDAIPNSDLRLYEETGHAPHVEQPQRFGMDLVWFYNSRVDD